MTWHSTWSNVVRTDEGKKMHACCCCCCDLSTTECAANDVRIWPTLLGSMRNMNMRWREHMYVHGTLYDMGLAGVFLFFYVHELVRAHLETSIFHCDKYWFWLIFLVVVSGEQTRFSSRVTLSPHFWNNFHITWSALSMWPCSMVNVLMISSWTRQWEVSPVKQSTMSDM
jgi:hypothetical protein